MATPLPPTVRNLPQAAWEPRSQASGVCPPTSPKTLSLRGLLAAQLGRFDTCGFLRSVSSTCFALLVPRADSMDDRGKGGAMRPRFTCWWRCCVQDLPSPSHVQDSCAQLPLSCRSRVWAGVRRRQDDVGRMMCPGTCFGQRGQRSPFCPQG